jgi:tetratricopeptide (TPR) repeat protein
MPSPHLNEIQLVEALGSCPRRFEGGSGITCFVIGSDSIHSSKAESAVLEVLKHLHSGRHIDRLFRNFDAAEKFGHVPVMKEDEEADLESYKSFPNEDITRQLTTAYLDRNWTDACWAFGMISSDPVHVHAFDDWYSWAVCKDALRLMDQRAGKVEIITSVLQEFLSEKLLGPLSFDELLRLVRLEWDDDEWIKYEQWLASPDFTVTLSALAREVEAAGGAIKELITQLELTRDYYTAARARIRALVRKSLKKMRETGSKTGGIVVGLPWLNYAADLVEQELVSFLMIVPKEVGVVSIIEGAQTLVKDPGAADNLSEVLLGKKMRSPVKAMLEGPQKLRESRATSWATAAEGILWQNESYPDREQLEKAEKCIAKSLELWPECPFVWGTKGMLLFMKGDKSEGVECFEKAFRLEPRNVNLIVHAAVRGVKSGLYEWAEKHCFRGLYLSPKHGLLWNNLGASYHYRGKAGPARYCFQKSAKFNEQHGIDNLKRTAQRHFTFLHCPPKLFPPILFFMNRVVIRLQRRWQKITGL